MSVKPPVHGQKVDQRFTRYNENALHRMFVNDNLLRVVLRMSLPGMLIALMGGLYLFVDQIMIIRLIPQDGVHHLNDELGGARQLLADLAKDPHYANELGSINALASGLGTGSIVRRAVNYSGVVVAMFMAVNLLFSNGTATRYSFYLGRRDIGRARETFALGCLLSAAITLVFSLVVQFVKDPWIAFEGNAEDLLANQPAWLSSLDAADRQTIIDGTIFAANQSERWAADFVNVLNWFVVTQSMFTCFQLTLRSEGKILVPMLISIATNLLNIVFEYVFLGVFKLGVAGGAWATVIGWCLSFTLVVGYVVVQKRRHGIILSLNLPKYLKWDWQIVIAIAYVGFASFIRNAAASFSGALQNNAIADVAGLEAGGYLSALGAINPIWLLLYPIFIGIIQGARNVSAFNYGAGRYDRVARSSYVAMGLGFFWGVFIYLVINMGLMRYLVLLFGVNEGTAQFNVVLDFAMRWFVSAPLLAFTLGGQLLYQSSERPFPSVIVSSMVGLTVYLPVLYVMKEVAQGDIYVFVWTTPAATGISALLTMAMMLYTVRYTLGRSKRDRKLHAYQKPLEQV